jgi:hypothetical protein
MVTVGGFSRLVSGIYAAAVTPQHWELAYATSTAHWVA